MECAWRPLPALVLSIAVRAKLIESSALCGSEEGIDTVGDFLEGGKIFRSVMIVTNVVLVFVGGCVSLIFIFGVWLTDLSGEQKLFLFAVFGPLGLATLAWSQSNLRWAVRHYFAPRRP